jgi:hypothetical protein
VSAQFAAQLFQLLTGGLDHVTFSPLCSSFPTRPRRQRNTILRRRQYSRLSHRCSIRYLLALT